ncbi:MAG: hypothetical protein AMJ88_03720 [Anaerolineae bacterium SM23_ 63]|nr:MAG: hypothetical protein AMJ88_03720 [Anaerolineae bacterium SM23_ 63]HEY45923.1 hypothetical protein [Anaerolineae bacterium]
MDTEGFRELLKTRKLTEEKIAASIALAEQFEAFIDTTSGQPDTETTWAFCTILIEEGQNTYDNLLTVARYGIFMKNNDIYIAILELLDGAEAQPNLYQKVGDMFGEAVRDEVFAGIGVSPLGKPPPEKPYDMFPVIERLIDKVGQKESERLLSTCLRDLPDKYFRNERRKYVKALDIDDYLKKKHRSFVRWIRKSQREGELFFAQEITDEVVAFVKGNQEIESGVREGNIIYVSKIPYNAKHYLNETDPTLKRYYACHCPWAREAIKNGNIRLNAVFCNCSGGFHKKPWEVIFDQTLQVEVLESVLKGDFRCRFAIHLPEKLEVA